VFDGAAPSLAACLAQAEDERRLWEPAGAKGISFLVAQLQVSRGQSSLFAMAADVT
jgi:hypothetical protein